MMIFCRPCANFSSSFHWRSPISAPIGYALCVHSLPAQIFEQSIIFAGWKNCFFLWCLEAAEKFSLFLKHFQNCPYCSLTKHSKNFRIVFYFFFFLCRSSETENFMLDDDNVELEAGGRGWVGKCEIKTWWREGKWENSKTFEIS